MAKYCFGIDIGGTTVKCGLFQTDGCLCEKWEIKTRTEDSGKQILPDVAETILDKMKAYHLNGEDVMGVGVGIPGPVEFEKNVVFAVNLHWGYTEVSYKLSGMLGGIPVKVGNDANVAALGEMWKGGGEGSSSIIMVTLGTGVGGGIIVNGKIVTGAHGAAGEIGHASINPDEPVQCKCGNHGCLEQYASATGIVRVAKLVMAESTEYTQLSEENLSAKTIFDAYKKNDAVAAKIVEKFADRLGYALGIFTTVIDPDAIVIGGGVSKAGVPLVEAVTKAFRRYAFSSCKDTPIVIAKLDNDAGIFGAAKLAIED